jgi:NAD(P)-dependent dehydrogenase (short-subunit alcohol dehydrogenase family)
VLDPIDTAGVCAFAKSFLDSGAPLHILINNAGIMAGPLARSKARWGSQFATNHMAFSADVSAGARTAP